MLHLTPQSDLRAFGFIFLPDYGGGTWTNGHIHFFNGVLYDKRKGTYADFNALRKMEQKGILTDTPQEGEEN